MQTIINAVEINQLTKEDVYREITEENNRLTNRRFTLWSYLCKNKVMFNFHIRKN